ncbi:MAG: Rne/Rng family ribonuclease [Rhodobacter sp.]|nr:Rne/Rng family ribonuclease [Rhodobacter sp.]
MAKKMLIDATHAEETRVVVVDGNKVEEFDFESENKRQLAGNIYLAKVSRVEPSLQAAFVEYGGNRHGFLAFTEIHPDYYQIPVADREALLAEERAYAEAQAEEEEKPKRTRRRRGRSKSESDTVAEAVKSDDAVESRDVSSDEIPGMGVVDLDADDYQEGTSPVEYVRDTPVETPAAQDAESGETARTGADEAPAEDSAADDDDSDADDDGDANDADTDDGGESLPDATERDDEIESVADEDVAEEIRQPRKPRPRRYKIQEVIKVRQILLVQVVKEERGNKGAALTTYLSLAGRYCVLMPNTARGGGISRKITNAPDRKKLKEIAAEIDVPLGAGLIIRTAGAQRTKSEIKRDYEYLQRVWEQIRELTLKSIAPAQIYEEGNLIKRSIRDLYNREIDEVWVEGEAGYRVAKDFMKMIMPSHAKNVKHYTEAMPLFARYQVESYLSSMFNPTVQLRSGGYIVIGVTEALVAIDVNSGRATKEGSIEDTATKTNLEAAEEVARQLRLRDLAGLIVIDFIDMEERRNNAKVEKLFKDKLKTDRARIQIGRISGFGLMEMSRQRLRPGMIEATTQPCAACHGTGLVRSDDNLSLNILRQLEEEGTRRRHREVLLKAPVGIVNFLMNNKREHVAQIEGRYGMSVRVEADPFMISPDFTIEKFKTATRVVQQISHVVSADASMMSDYEEEDEVDETEAVSVSDAPAAPEADESDGAPKKRRRRRRRRRGGSNGEAGDNGQDNAQDSAQTEAAEAAEAGSDVKSADGAADSGSVAVSEDGAEDDEKPKKRRRRSRSKKSEAVEDAGETAAEVAPDVAVKSESVVAAVAETAEETAEQTPAEPVEKPKRKRASRAKKKPEETAPDVAPEPAAETVADSEPEPVVETAPEPDPVVETAAAPEPEPEIAPEPEPELVSAEPEPVAARPDPAKPKRRGWWSIRG